ncbi:unnamed protein product [Rhizoctonia solani]|uniref:General alpha-glucoside permease [Schizosaccharomyces pombe 972h-] n=1 Tax=Rhizoctonia solani TaxID=456999 RepID=A0A8H3EDR2_9AGAM|nr:unnamed protein product [Rhizoctonia solani]
MASSGAPENGSNGQSGQLNTNFSFPTGGGSAPGSPVEYREPLPHMETVIQKRQRSRSKSKEAGRTQPGPKSFWDLIALTISMAGAQVTWTVELGYGTPFLRDLGLSSTLTSLVWLAGPLSGLIAQPLIGAVSDSSTSKYRRRYWVAMSTLVLFVAALGLAFAIPFARWLVSLFNSEPPVPDPEWDNSVRQTAIGVAVLCFYLLDFALNALQASLRNLLLDVTPAEQLTTANAWHGRMIHAGNIIGFAFGGITLENWPILRQFGGDQFRKVCIVTMVILAVTVWITLVTQEEKEKEVDLLKREEGRIMDIIKTIWHASLNLPRPIRRVCYVQLCAWVGWFPFLFFGTTWMGVIMSEETGTDPTKDEATVAGDKAMLIYSVVAVIAGTLLPSLASRDQRLLLPELPIDPNNPEATADAELARVRDLVRQWRAEAARDGRPLRLPAMPFMLRNIWTGALLLFFVLMMSTFFIKTVWAGTLVIALLGICWAVACWVPFAIIMEYLKEMDDSARANRVAAAVAGNTGPSTRPGHSRVFSTPAHPVRRLARSTSAVNPNERTMLLRRYSMNMTENEMNMTELNVEGSGDVAGGTILGIHNLAIVLPQFFVSIASSIIFNIFDGSKTGDTLYLGKHGVSWVLRFGGVIALIGAAISRRVPPTKTEKAMQNNLFLVRRLVQRTDIRNPDPGPSRFTSLAWAAVLACEEVFEFLLESGHDEEELSRDAENNTVLILLAGAPTPPARQGQPRTHSLAQAHLRMAQLYLDRYAFLLDWPNVQGMSALHQAALKGNEAFVRMLLDMGAFLDQADHQGNTPLHYASAWGHVQVVQLLIERGCQFALRNNEGFTASDYAYSMSTMNTLQDTVRAQFEVNKKQKAERLRNLRRTSDDEFEDVGYNGYPGRFPDAVLDPQEPNRFRSGSASTSEGTIESNVASRMRERDADAMAEYRRQGGLEGRRIEDEEAMLQRQRSVSSSSLGVPTEASGASAVSGGNLGSTGSQSQISGSGGGGRKISGSNKALPPPPGVHPFANASQFSTPTQFPTPLQSQFSPPSNFSGSFTPSARNHPIAGEPMPPPPSPGRRLRAVASANALGTMVMAQTTRPKRAGTNEGLATSSGLAHSPAGRSVLQGRSTMSSPRPPPALPPPTGPLPSAPPPPTPPPKTGSTGSAGMIRETPKREASGGSGSTSGRETPKKEGKETPSRTGLGLRAGVLGVVKPMLSPSALNGSFFSRGESSGANSGSARTVEASR